MLQNFRHLIQRNGTAVLELVAEDRGQQLRLERRVIDRRGSAQRCDRGDGAVAKGDAHLLGRILPGRMGERPRVDVDLHPAGNIVTSLRESGDLTVTETVELLDEIVGAEDDAAFQRREVSEDARWQRQAPDLELPDRLLVDVQRQDRDRRENDHDRDADRLKNSAPARKTCVEGGHGLMGNNCKVASTSFPPRVTAIGVED